MSDQEGISAEKKAKSKRYREKILDEIEAAIHGMTVREIVSAIAEGKINNVNIVWRVIDE